MGSGGVLLELGSLVERFEGLPAFALSFFKITHERFKGFAFVSIDAEIFG